ncbi:hypothetical protein HQ545_01015 [Candidatus Woesearchaeota archaeon]|nr:hypothetical protein [Candidatus Woesearchaeota archaeon]
MELLSVRQVRKLIIAIALLLFIGGAGFILYAFMYGEVGVTGAAVTDMPDDSIVPGVIPGADNLTNITNTSFKGSPSDSSGDYQPLEYYGYTAPDVETRISGGGGRGGGLSGGGSNPVQVMSSYPNCPDTDGNWTVITLTQLNQDAVCDEVEVTSAILNFTASYTLTATKLTLSSGNITSEADTHLNINGDISLTGSNIYGNIVNITANDMTIDANSEINSDEGGCPSTQSPNPTTNVCSSTGQYVAGYGEGSDAQKYYGGAGAGHGGYGGVGRYAAGMPYGSALRPIHKGSGGGIATCHGGAGGGVVRIMLSGTLTNNGEVTSDAAYGGNGLCGYTYGGPGGGSGGSIWATADTIAGAGTFSADGGHGDGTRSGGGGSGGRVAVYYNTSSFTGMSTSTVTGGITDGNPWPKTGEDGTMIFVDVDSNTITMTGGAEFNSTDYYSGGSFKPTVASTFNFNTVTMLFSGNIRFKGTTTLNATSIDFKGSNVTVTEDDRLTLQYTTSFLDTSADWFSESGVFYLSLEEIGTGRIDYTSGLSSFSDLSENKILNMNYASINSSNENGLNASANVTLHGLSFVTMDVGFDTDHDGVFLECPSTICTEIDYNGSTAIFGVTQFSAYTIGEDGEFWTVPTQNENYVTGQGTNLSSYNYTTIQMVSDYTWHSEGNGVIEWKEDLNLSLGNIGNDHELDQEVTFGSQFVSIDSSAAPAFASRDANVTFEGIDCSECNANYILYTAGAYGTLEQIRSNGLTCDASGTCSNFVCSIPGGVGDCTFDVTGFSGYGYGANANITINDSAEGGTVNASDPITFYAYYLNATSGDLITGAQCNFTDDDVGPIAMTEDASYYYYTKAAGYGSEGIETWNVTCHATGFSRVNASDTVNVTSAAGVAVDRSSSVVPVTVTVLNESRWNATGGGNDIAKAGNVTELDLSSSSSTNKWAGYYGEVSGDLRLANTDNDIMYDFGVLNQSQVKSVFASTDQNFGFATLYAASTANVDSMYGWDTTDSDSATLTLDDDTATISTVTSVSVANLSASTVYQSGAFKDVAGLPSAFGELAYGVSVIVDQTAFNGYTQVDYELIVPVNSSAGTQTYYFFMDIE